MDLPKTMTFITLDGHGGPEVLKPAEMDTPQPGDGEILIKVEAAGVNRPDVQQRKGMYNPPPGASTVPGLEVAGTVAALGAGTSRYSVGDAVCALAPGGGYAQFCKVPERHALPVPSNLSMVEAGGVPETYFTVWTNVFDRARLRAGESILIHGGSSGIGTTAIQLAREFGATVYTTVGNAEKAKVCEDLGAARAINYRDEDFVAVVKEATGGPGVNVILDMVGGSYIQKNIDALAVDGRLVQIAWLGGAKTEANFMKLMVKRLTWTGSTLRPRSIEDKAAMAANLEAKVWPLIEVGRVKPLIYKIFPLSEAAEAHRLMETSTHIGKIMLTVE